MDFKKISVAGLLIALLSGCSSKTIEVKEEKAIKAEKKEEKIPYIYNGSFKVKYAPKRVVWFSPYITKEGDVVSERTITILPSYPIWTNKEENKISDEILEFLESENG